MNKEKRGLSMLLSGILRRVRSGQSSSNDAIYLAAILQNLLIQTNNQDIAHFIVDRTYDRVERDSIDNVIKHYEGAL